MAERPVFTTKLPPVHAQPEVVDGAVFNMAIPTLWEKSYLCPCRNIETRQPQSACKICHGRGISFFPPKPMDIAIQSQEKGVFNSDLGLLDSGTAIGTPRVRHRVSFRDRITLPEATVSQQVLFNVTRKRVDHGFYMIYDVREIEAAMAIEGQLFEGKDYEVDLKENLFFPKEHLLGKNVSLNLVTTLRYLVSDLLKEHRYSKNPTTEVVTPLPQKLLLKREDVFIEREAFELGVSDGETSEMIDTKRPPALDGLNGFFRNGGLNG